ncbi:hypothetical protein EDI28_13595 [Photobacterium chitinilyticum]|uniref:LysR substrate-binding domain-containing protein n=1 Tax=Photobacterium chitinilyticum TaxID=2485123 RepID=A0A444JNY3_9GAMM|nr:hypothetical protein EDI28_13595 [Photobacterium chitinilyticum]
MTGVFGLRHIHNVDTAIKTLTVAALKGSGVVLQPRLILSEALMSGSLTEVLQDERPKVMPVNLLYKSKQLPLKNRTFVDYILDEIVNNRRLKVMIMLAFKLWYIELPSRLLHVTLSHPLLFLALAVQ